MANPGGAYSPYGHHIQTWTVALNVDGSTLSRAFDAAFSSYGLPVGGYNLSSGFMKPLKIDDTGALVVAASVSASIAAFAPLGIVKNASVTTTTSRVAFATADANCVLHNTGSIDLFFKLGSVAVNAAVTDYLLKAGEIICLDRTGLTHIAAITASGSTSLEAWSGTGLTTSSQAGGSGGGGGNVNLNQVGGVAVALGQTTMSASLPVVIASNQSAVPVSGTFWQATQPVSFTMPALVAGAAIIGKVGIDQTTPGTTNGVQLNAAIPAGVNIIGKVSIDQTTNGVTNAVDILNMPVTLDTNAGNLSASTIRLCLATNSAAIALWGHGATGAAVPANAIYVGMNVAGNLTGLVGTANGLKVDGSAVTQPVSGTVNQGGVTPILVDALSTTVKGVLASAAGVLEDYYCYNPNAAVTYIQIFDIATTGAVTLGTSVPKWSIAIPPASAANLSRLGLSFASGIQVAATTTAKGSTTPTTACDCNFGYR